MLRVNNRPVEFTFDTGAEVSVITEKTSKMLGLELTEPEKALTAADGSKLNVAGMSKVCIKSTFRSVNALVYVLRGSGRNLLGLPEIRSLNLLGRKMAIVKRKGEECDSGSANKFRTGTPSYASAVAGRTAPQRGNVLSKVESFLTAVNDDGIMNESEYEGRCKQLESRREEIELCYRQEMEQMEQERRELETEFEATRAMREAIANLAAAKAHFECTRRTTLRPVVPPTPAVRSGKERTPAATLVTVDDPRAGLEESLTPTLASRDVIMDVETQVSVSDGREISVSLYEGEASADPGVVGASASASVEASANTESMAWDATVDDEFGGDTGGMDSEEEHEELLEELKDGGSSQENDGGAVDEIGKTEFDEVD